MQGQILCWLGGSAQKIVFAAEGGGLVGKENTSCTMHTEMWFPRDFLSLDFTVLAAFKQCLIDCFLVFTAYTQKHVVQTILCVFDIKHTKSCLHFCGL